MFMENCSWTYKVENITAGTFCTRFPAETPVPAASSHDYNQIGNSWSQSAESILLFSREDPGAIPRRIRFHGFFWGYGELPQPKA